MEGARGLKEAACLQAEPVGFRGYATGAIPYFPTLRFPGQYAETEKYINWNRYLQ